MAFSTWHNYGIGICTDKVEKNTDMDRIREFVRLAPEFEKELIKCAKECNETEWEKLSFDEFMESLYDWEYYNGFADIMARVMSECEGIAFDGCDDFDGYDYVIFSQCYPWQLNEKERSLTEDDVRDVFRKYIAILTNEPIEIDNQEIENGG